MSQPEYYPSLRRHTSTSHAPQLTDDQWFLIADLFDCQSPTPLEDRTHQRLAASLRMDR